jgi:serine/threonine-protein kinase
MTVSDTITSLGAALAPHYALERELGRGGMATVYLARDLRHDRTVALKVLRPELGASLGPERFQREIHLAARLSHPNILPLFDSGEAGGRLWYTMPYVEGESLRQRLGREAQLGVAETLRIAGQVAGALAHAHGKGIVHRDIKPENILLAGDQALVADFGIAKALDASSAEKLTETGLSLGTPSYMSPEQGSGGAVDARSDIYALGCVLYEMLAGGPPFTGPTAQSILARHAVDPVPPLRTVRSTIPEAVERAVERALAKVPADRFATAAEFAEALVADHAPRLPLRRRLSARSARLGLGIVISAAAAGLGAWAIRGRSTPTVVPSAANIAVLPLVSTAADTSLVRLGRDLAVTVSASLDGVGGIETADRLSVANATTDRANLSPGEGAALARRLGASSILRGTLVRAGDHVRLDLGLYGTDGLAPLAEGITVSNHRDSIGPLTDSVAWALLRQVWQRGEPPSPSLDVITTRSIPALRAFLQGERELGANRWGEALLAYRGAIAADSTFGMAHFRYALTRFWTWQPVEPEVLDALRKYRSRFPERERLLIDAFLTSGNTPRLKIERHAVATRRFPGYWPAWFLYADALFHNGPIDGHDWSEGLEAFRRVVTLNPNLVPAWEHIYDLTVGRDQAEAARAYASLMQLGWLEGQPPGGRLLSRLLAGVGIAGGALPPSLVPLADSTAEFVVSPRGKEGPAVEEFEPLFLLKAGFPAAQLDLNRRALATGRAAQPLRTALRAANAWAWAARGGWDSALAIVSEAAANPDVRGITPLAFQDYGLAVLGALFGGTAPAVTDAHRSRAMERVVRLTDEESKPWVSVRLAWFDGLLGFARGDRHAIQAARGDAAKSGWNRAQLALVDRSLAAFDLALRGDRKRAGRELAALEEYCILHEDCGSLVPDIAVQRFFAAQWLGEAGDVEQARRLLRWHDAPWPGWAWTSGDVLAGPTYLVRARLEEARGDSALAGDYYRQFLRRYDQPIPSQVHLVQEATAALARLTADR